MKIHEIISEAATKKMPHSQKQAMSNMQAHPSMNMSTGSAYLNYRFGVAMAGAPEIPTPKDNFVGGDPLTSAYTDEDMNIIKYAAKQVGVKLGKNETGRGSKEADFVNTTSPTANIKKNKYGI